MNEGIIENRTRIFHECEGMMNKRVENITASSIQSFVQKAVKGSKKACGGGLNICITPAGSAKWRYRYRINKDQRTYTIGDYPEISLAAARNELSDLKKIVKAGKDPVLERRLKKAAAIASGDNKFHTVATQWLTKKKPEWSEDHYKKSARAIERDILPSLGKLPISEITAAMIATTLEKILKRGVSETAARITQHLEGIFNYAQAKSLCQNNPVIPAKEILPRKKDNGRMPSIRDWNGLGDILRRAHSSNLSLSVKMAHRLCAFTAARIGNVVSAEWQEFNLESTPPIWRIRRDKLKVKKSREIDLRIPLCPELVAELKAWQQIYGASGFLFPSPQKKDKPHIDSESVEKAYRETLNLRGKHCPHGWRSAFSTLARDNNFEREVVELSLDHIHDNEVAMRYDQGERFNKRIDLFNWWGKELMAAQAGAPIIPIKKKA